jgi:hypothetical protein
MSNFKLGIRAIHQKNIKTAILEAKKNGFEVLEIHLSSPQFLPQNHTKVQLKDIRTFSAKSNVILQVHSEINSSLIEVDDIIRRAEKQRLERVVRFSRQLGARCLTLHPGKAPTYYLGNGGKVSQNDDIYSNLYNKLFEDSIKHIISIAPKDLFICIENTDNFTVGYRKVLSKYLKTNKIFLTWDILKNLNFKTGPQVWPKQWEFIQKNFKYVRNLHVSGPEHGSLKGLEKNFIPFFELFKNKNLPR